MTERALPFVNVAMWSGDTCSTATKGAKEVIDGATPLVLEAIRRMPDKDPTAPFTMTDMGCADGGTSLAMVRQTVGAARARWPLRPVTVVYADQPRNDYNSLFHLLHGLTPLPTYLGEVEDVHVLASATSFYRPILPAGTLDLGFSATAMHWLSCKPCDLTTHVHMVGAMGAELAAFTEQGRRDWETILLRRARELAPGGRLVLVNFCQDEAGRYLGNTGGVNMFDTFNALWRRFAAEGVISSEEYVAMTFPQYYKTVEEFTHPLTDTASPVYRMGLRLEHCAPVMRYGSCKRRGRRRETCLGEVSGVGERVTLPKKADSGTEKKRAPREHKAQARRALLQGQAEGQRGEERLSLVGRLSTERSLQDALEQEQAVAWGRGRYEARGEKGGLPQGIRKGEGENRRRDVARAGAADSRASRTLALAGVEQGESPQRRAQEAPRGAVRRGEVPAGY